MLVLKGLQYLHANKIQMDSCMPQKFIVLLCGLLASACVSTHTAEKKSPTHSLAQQLNGSAQKRVGMVVAANPYASKAGADVLRAGGSAVDAAIAIEAVLSLVEPQSSGLAGGGFMVHFDNQTNTLTAYDGRETAPEKVSPDMFLNDEGKSIDFINAKNSGLSTGVPGMVAMLKLAHDDHGALPWGVQFNRAKELALNGFEVSPRLHGMITRFAKFIPNTPEDGPTEARDYFFDGNGEPLAVGALRDNKPYAKTLELIASDANAFYRGRIAEEIVAQVSRLPRAGALTLSDMAAYKAGRKRVVCASLQLGQLCGPPPPSSWLAVGQVVGLLESQGLLSSELDWVAFAEAQRLAYADRDQYVGDSDFVSVPVGGMLSPEYWRERAKDKNQALANQALKAGNPWLFGPEKKVAYGNDNTQDMAGTTHFVVVDAEGDVVSLTASVESIFGSTRMAGGMFLNNQLTDFAFKAVDQQGVPVANRIEPKKRPRSSMSPTIMLDANNEFLLATGSPGGNSIIAYTAKTIVGTLAWGLSAQQSVELPNLVARGDTVRIEKERASDAVIQSLKAYGFNVKESAGENSGLSVVRRLPNGELEGGVDPRREGTIERVEFD